MAGSQAKSRSQSRPIVLVEDDPHHAELIIEALGQAGLANPVIRLETGQEALAYFFEGARWEQARALAPEAWPCLVILDLRLPDLGGLEVLRRLKQDRRLELIPVMVLTTSGEEEEEEDIKRAYDVQANAYVIKPIDYQQFLEKVQEAVRYWVQINDPLPA
jgi:two-component system response regulator